MMKMQIQRDNPYRGLGYLMLILFVLMVLASLLAGSASARGSVVMPRFYETQQSQNLYSQSQYISTMPATSMP